MKKKFLWAILVVVIIYSGLWFFTSRIVEHKAHEYLDKLKKEKVISEYSGNISVTGFPFSFNINLSHPRLKFKKEDAGYRTDLDMLFDGVLAVDLGFFSDTVRFQTIGDLHLKGYLNNYNLDHTISGQNSYYQVQLANSLILTAIKGSIDASKDTAKNLLITLIDGVDIHTEKLSVMNKLTNKLLIYANEIDMELDIGDDINNLDVGYRENISDAEFDKEFKILASEILSIPFMREAVDKVDINVRNYFDIFSFDKLGKANHKIDLKVNLSNGSSAIKINKLSLHDAILDLDATGTIGLGNEAKADISFESKFSTQWHRLARIYADKLHTEASSNKAFAATKNSIVLNIFGSVFSFFTNMFSPNISHATLVPELQDMGIIKGAVNIDFKEIGSGFDLNVKKFKISTDKFAIDASGAAKNSGNGGDKYNLKAQLTQYGYIIDSAVSYVNRVESNVGTNFFLIFGKKLAISQSISDKIKFFIRRLSDEPNSNSQTLNLTIVNKDGGTYPAVGSYSSKEFARVWNSFIFNILLGEIVGGLNPESMAKTLLQGPVNIVTDLPGTVQDLPKKAANIAKNLLGGILGLNSTNEQGQ